MKDFGLLNNPGTSCSVCGSRNHETVTHQALNDAAPELLEACKFALRGLEAWQKEQEENHPESVDGWKVIADVKAAIQKAEEQS